MLRRKEVVQVGKRSEAVPAILVGKPNGKNIVFTDLPGPERM